MTQNDIVRRIIKKNGCQGISCSGRKGWNKGTACPFFEKECEDSVLNAEAWAKKHGLATYSSTFEVNHRFKPGDRVQHKDDPAGLVATVAEVMLGADCGVFYRFAEDGVPAGSVSYCDENLRLADCDNEAEKAKEMP